MTTLKRHAAGELSLDQILPRVLSQPTVAFHLLPMGKSAPKVNRQTQAKGRGKSNGKSRKGSRGPNVWKIIYVMYVS